MDKSISIQTKKNKSKKDQLYVIGIGSSAGGLKALEEFFDNCPSDTGFAFVIIQHLSPDYKSLMPELLSRHTKMSVKEAKEGDEVTANHVYLIPGVKNIQIKNGKLELKERPPSNQINFSIDLFFKSLAIEQKDRALAVILSGTGSDGTKGAKEIKEVGGTVFVQNPESSGFDGMPRSAISQGLADYILNPEEMGAELVDFVSQPQYVYTTVKGGLTDNAESLDRILKIIKNYTGYDFFYYKKPTLLRRTAKRISITKSQTAENYIDYLYNNPEEKFLLTQEYLIGVTKFFRDSSAFDIMRREVIPAIISSKKNTEDSIKIWVVACSTGEEAYSITILIEDYMRKHNLDIDYKVFATDLDDRGIDVATKGIYKHNIEAEVPAEILNEYFIKKESDYQIHPSIRKRIIFSKHDILQNPPFNKMDLVSCRNMLIYMENNIQLQVLSSIHYALNKGGYLFLGSSENLGILNKNFEEISNKWKIYKNVQSERILNINRNDIWRVEKEGSSRFKTRNTNSSIEDRIAKSINKLLMDTMPAVSICIDDSFEIIHAVGKLKKYLVYPDEGYSNNLLKMLPDELNIPIASAVRKLTSSTDANIEKSIRLVTEGNVLKHIRLVVSSLSIVSNTSRSYLITIIESSEHVITKEDTLKLLPAISSGDNQLEELKEALSETRENLQSTIEELETSNEEMQATNEELLASNEELQSTNEELQSLNEELHTVNAELQEKNAQLIELNSDVENLMKNINIGTIFLDRDFKIRKYTPSIREHFKLRLEDVGRSISHFSGTLGGQDLIEYSRQVIKTLEPFRKEVTNSNGSWFLMQIFPYRSQEDAIQGVVINFIDITELKFAIKEKDKANNFLSHILDTNPAAVYVYDIINKKNIYSSSNILDIAGYSEKDLTELGANMLPTIIHPDDLNNVIKHHEKLTSLRNNERLQLEYRVVHKKTKKSIWLLATDTVNERNKKGEVSSILGTSQIITDFKEMEDKIKVNEERYRLAISATQSGLWEWSDLLNDKAWWSPEIYKLLGYSKRELKTSFSDFIDLVHPDQVKVFREGLEEHVETGIPFQEDVKIKTKNEGYKWYRVNAQMKQNEDSKEIKKIVGTILDINTKKESEKKMKDLNVELERFAYLASHDLKEPLRTVTSFTKLFKDEYKAVLDDNAFQYIDFIEGASARMITLTNDLLVYSQLDDKSLNFEMVNLNKLLSNIKDDLHQTIIESKAEITVDKLPNIVCDALQIKQLFQNLISNSLKYRGDNKPRISIGYIKKPRSFEFHVKDNGIGISKEHHEKIFEVFKRLHSQVEYEGTGIGLANCKRIVLNHNGKIRVKSEEGKGSEFLFEIPIIKT
ncbi:chemotaxis protein CheB [Aquimarina agarilytica]|uniref:chemotaxis protein CheB n=1 Tax=Aquimarina agarilytica TaxID=1087449 RepID=UPI000288BC1D|nr:chemotaxis protein CheB [Aquimarina agarilytica]